MCLTFSVAILAQAQETQPAKSLRSRYTNKRIPNTSYRLGSSTSLGYLIFHLVITRVVEPSRFKYHDFGNGADLFAALSTFIK